MKKTVVTIAGILFSVSLVAYAAASGSGYQNPFHYWLNWFKVIPGPPGPPAPRGLPGRRVSKGLPGRRVSRGR
jgi:hypothetical protein